MKKYVYLVTNNATIKGESDTYVRAFSNVDKAKAYMMESIKQAETDLPEDYYTLPIIVDKNDMAYSRYLESRYSEAHIDITILKMQVN